MVFSDAFSFAQFIFSLAAFHKVINIHTRLVKAEKFLFFSQQVIVTFSTTPQSYITEKILLIWGNFDFS
jgi:hypothetical protein